MDSYSEAYDEGYEAFSNGQHRNAYKARDGDKFRGWQDGWDEARTAWIERVRARPRPVVRVQE